MIDKNKVIEACEILRDFCQSILYCYECPLNDHCRTDIRVTMDNFIDDLQNMTDKDSLN